GLSDHEIIEPFIEHQGERRLFWLRRPRAVGSRLLVARAGAAVTESRRRGRVVVLLDPESAFGTGGHGTTEGCLLALEERVAGGESVLDVGSGTGILAVAARKLGAGSVTAVDIDARACRATRRNLALNGVEDRVEVIEAGVESVQGRFGIVLANLRTPILLNVMDGVVGRVAEGGVLILSGILERELHPFLAFLEKFSLTMLKTLRICGWMTLVFAGGPGLISEGRGRDSLHSGLP
ncbi:MAG TPA: 50S ribosomal protein L11 methyltransferase, partial [Candidatus Deferrimicrobiaceae bacterium]